ncbi:MAG: DUF6158 family protein [Pseudonocardiaceae bacterium]
MPSHPPPRTSRRGWRRSARSGARTGRLWRWLRQAKSDPVCLALSGHRRTTFLHGAPDALGEHSSRTATLEEEYLRRHPERD